MKGKTVGRSNVPIKKRKLRVLPPPPQLFLVRPGNGTRSPKFVRVTAPGGPPFLRLPQIQLPSQPVITPRRGRLNGLFTHRPNPGSVCYTGVPDRVFVKGKVGSSEGKLVVHGFKTSDDGYCVIKGSRPVYLKVKAKKVGETTYEIDGTTSGDGYGSTAPKVTEQNPYPTAIRVRVLFGKEQPKVDLVVPSRVLQTKGPNRKFDVVGRVVTPFIGSQRRFVVNPKKRKRKCVDVINVDDDDDEQVTEPPKKKKKF